MMWDPLTTASYGHTRGLSPTRGLQQFYMRRNLCMDLERYPGTRMLLIGPPWMLESQKMHGGHFTYSPTGSMLGW
jgi:hypothetical protein